MTSLVLKDLMLLKGEKRTLFIILFCIYTAFQASVYASMWIGIQLLFMVYFLLNYANYYDSRYKSEILLNSLPLTRKEVVGAKYLTALSLAGILILLIAVFSSLIKIGILLSGYKLQMPVTSFTLLEAVWYAIFMLCIYIGIYLPLYFMFGYLKSRWINVFMFAFLFSSVTVLSNIINQQGKIVVSGFYLFIAGIIFLFLSAKVSEGIYERKSFC